MYHVMGTGSRSMVVAEDRAEIYKILEYKIMLLFEQHPDLVLISGMAEGWDEAIAKVGFRNQIPYDVYIPTNTYGQYYWGKNSLMKVNRLEKFIELVEGARYSHIVSNELYVNGVHANFVRNQAMVDASDHALVYNPKSSGTKDAVAKLKKAKVPFEVYPFSQGVLFT